MSEGTRGPSRNGGPCEPGRWRERYGELGAEELGELRPDVVSLLMARGLSATTASDYAGLALVAERFCRERGTTVLAASPELIGRLASTLGLHQRARLASALRHYFAVLGRPFVRVPALQVAGRQPGRTRARSTGRPIGRPHTGHEWEVSDSGAGERVRTTREAMLRDGKSEPTIRHYASMLWRAECWAAGRGLTLAELGARDLADYGDTLSRHSRRSLRSALRCYYAALAVEDPPIKALRVPRKARMVARPLEVDEARRLLAAAIDDGGPRGVAVLLGLLLGLRRFEIAKLRFADFSGGWVRFVGKGSLEATLPVPELVSAKVAELAHDSPWLFPGRSGGPTSPASIWGWVRSLARDAGIADVSTHRLRHTCLTLANDATGDLRAVQEFARHADPDTTAGYTRVTRDRLSSVGHAVLEALSTRAVGVPAEPLVPMSLLALATNGPGGVAEWVELARLLYGRPGWRLSTTEDGAGVLLFEYGLDLEACVLSALTRRPACYLLSRWIDREAEHDVSWEFPDIGSLSAVLGEFETGPAIPFTPTRRSVPGPGEGQRVEL